MLVGLALRPEGKNPQRCLALQDIGGALEGSGDTEPCLDALLGSPRSTKKRGEHVLQAYLPDVPRQWAWASRPIRRAYPSDLWD